MSTSKAVEKILATTEPKPLVPEDILCSLSLKLLPESKRPKSISGLYKRVSGLISIGIVLPLFQMEISPVSRLISTLMAVQGVDESRLRQTLSIAFDRISTKIRCKPWLTIPSFFTILIPLSTLLAE